MLDEGITDKAELVRPSFLDVHGRKEAVGFRAERGLSVLGVSKLPKPMRIAPGLEDAA